MENNHENRMKAISDFFSKISKEELEEKLLEAGAGRIKESCDSDYVLAIKGNISRNSDLYSIGEDMSFHEFSLQDDLRGAA